MTDAEIIKALECCNTEDGNGFANCDDCPYYAKGMCLTCPEIFDLINRQKAEIEILKKNPPSFILTDDESFASLTQKLPKLNPLVMSSDNASIVCIDADKIKAEAIKEFAERLKTELSFGKYIQADQIDNLVKEMVGDTE